MIVLKSFIFLFFLTLLGFGNTIAQELPQREIENILKEIKQENSRETKESLFLKAFKLAQKMGDSTLNKVQLSYGNHYLRLREYDKASTFYVSIIESNDPKSQLEVAHAYNNQGIIYKKQGRYNEALTFFNEAAENHRRRNDVKNRVGSIINAAQVCKYQGDLKKEISLLFKARPLIDSLQNKPLQATLYYSLSIAHRSIKEYEKAIKFQQKAIDIRRELKDYKRLAASYNTMGNIYREQRVFEKAIPYFRQAIVIKDSLNLLTSLAVSYHNLASVYAIKKRNDSALYYYKTAYFLRDSLQDAHGLANTGKELAFSYLNIGKFDLAKNYLDKTERWAESAGELSILLRTIEIKITYYKKRNKADSVLFYSDKYLELYKEFYERDKAKSLLKLQQQYESKNKDELINDLKQKEAQLLQDKKIKNLEIGQKNLILIICLILFLLLGILFIYYRNRMRLKYIKAHQVGQELVKRYVATSLHDQVANKISGIRLKIVGLINGNNYAKDHKKIAKELGLLYENVRKLSHQLAPVAYHLEKQTITQALSNFFSDFERYRKIKTDVKGLGDTSLNMLKKQSQIAVYCVLEELLLNSYKHSKTPKVDITILENRKGYTIQVEDFGIGLPKKHNKGIGLHNIQSHVTLLRGSFEIHNTDSGCMAQIIFPKKHNVN